MPIQKNNNGKKERMCEMIKGGRQFGKEYLTTKEVAIRLGLSIGTIQKMVNLGKIRAGRTEGGHRRIHIQELEDYQKSNGYTMKNLNARICVLTYGGGIDSGLLDEFGKGNVYITKNLLDVIQLQNKVDVIFIDARCEWIAPVSHTLIEKLAYSCRVCIYNSKSMAKSNPTLSIRGVAFSEMDINIDFLNGFLIGIMEVGALKNSTERFAIEG